MLAKQVEKTKRDEGFTLIELLVVVIIIGILAAIAIPVFLNQRQSAWEGSVESDVRNAAIEAETAATRAGGVYPANINGRDVQASANVTLYYEQVDSGDSFTICGTHSNVNGGSDSITYDSDAGGLADADWETASCGGSVITP